MMKRTCAGLGLTRCAMQVSCGPYHSAALTSSGALFTWGDGLCGKLGHGDQQSISEPRQVCTLSVLMACQAACTPKPLG